METLKAEYKNGFWYINNKPKLFATMSYEMPSNSKGWHYILVNNGVLIDAIPCPKNN